MKLKPFTTAQIESAAEKMTFDAKRLDFKPHLETLVKYILK